MLEFTEKEELLLQKITKLKEEAGTHSPSIFTFLQKLPEISIQVDACFLSNPYATDLFLKYFKEEIIDTGKIRQLLEFYPSQNAVIGEVLSNFLSIPQENIFVANGAIEIIQAVIHNFTEKKILINIPTFSSYYEFVKDGIDVVFNELLKEENFELNTDRYIEKVTKEKPDTIVLINPNNPNGAYSKFADIKRILDATAFVKNVIIDESFIHFAYEDKSFELISTAKLVEQYPNLIIIKSMSKDFGIAGVRAGYAVMRKERISSLLKTGFLWNSNGLAEYFFRLYTRADFAQDYEKVRIQYIVETIDFIKELKKIPLIKVYPSLANFVLIELPAEVSTTKFVTALLIKYGIYIRNCSDKIGLHGNFVRVASRSKTENQFIIDSFKKIFGLN